MIGKAIKLLIGIPSWFLLWIVIPIAAFVGGFIELADGNLGGIVISLFGLAWGAFAWMVEGPKGVSDAFRTDVLDTPQYVINRENEARREAQRAAPEPSPTNKAKVDAIPLLAQVIFCVGFGLMIMVAKSI